MSQGDVSEPMSIDETAGKSKWLKLKEKDWICTIAFIMKRVFKLWVYELIHRMNARTFINAS